MEADREKENDRIMEIVSDLKEREKRRVLRQLRNGEIDYDAKIDKLVYADTKELFEIDREGSDGDEDSDEDDNEM